MDPNSTKRKRFILRPEQLGRPARYDDGKFYGLPTPLPMGRGSADVMYCRVRDVRAKKNYCLVLGWKLTDFMHPEGEESYIDVALISEHSKSRQGIEAQLRPIVGGDIHYLREFD